MKKQFTLFCAISLLAIGIVTFSSCKKTSAFNGSYSGQLIDSVTSVNDTMTVTISGNNITIKDNNTGSTLTGTIGNTTSAAGVSLAEINTLSGSVKLGGVSTTYSGSTATGSLSTANGTTTLSLILTDNAGSSLSFDGNKY